jgi:hypothetical protein
VLAIGPYPMVSLASAREARDEAKRLLFEGVDPNVRKKEQQRPADTFRNIAAEYVEKITREGRAERTLSKNNWLLGMANETFGDLEITEIGAPKILEALRLVEPALPEVLNSLGMSPIGSLNAKKPTRWRMTGSDFVVDFLAPSFDEREGPQKLEALGVWAQGLHFLNFLIRDPIPAAALYREGVLVQVPRPERFAIHKLIVAARRHGPGKGKAEKDIEQARALIAALGEMRPHELGTVYEEALQQGDAWRMAIEASLKRAPDIRKLIESVL